MEFSQVVKSRYSCRNFSDNRECLQDGGKNAFLCGATAFVALFESMPDNIRCEKYGNDRFVKYDVGQMAAYLTLCAKTRGWIAASSAGSTKKNCVKTRVWKSRARSSSRSVTPQKRRRAKRRKPRKNAAPH